MQISGMMDVFTVVFEVQSGDMIRSQTMQAPRIMLQQQFISLMEDASYSGSPVRIKMSMEVHVWSQFDKKWIHRERSVEFANDAYQRIYGKVV